MGSKGVPGHIFLAKTTLNIPIGSSIKSQLVLVADMKKENYVIGVDYGTDSVRSIIANAANGQEVASAVYYYPRWKDGLYCNPGVNQFRQHPLDYLEGLEQTITRCLLQAGPTVTANIRAISVDTTGSTPVA